MCPCGLQYCSTACQDTHSHGGHALLCPSAEDGLACASTLHELLKVESDSALFLPLAVHVAAGIVSEAASGSSARAKRVLASADALIGSCTKGGLWLRTADAAVVDGHYQEDLEEEGSEAEKFSDEEDGEEEEEKEEEAEGESGGDEDDEEQDEEGTSQMDALEAEVALLLPSVWTMLLECFAARLSDCAAARHVHAHLASQGPSWLAALLATMERNAVPAIAPSPLKAYLEATLLLPESEQSSRLASVVEPLVAAIHAERGDGRPTKRRRRDEDGSGGGRPEAVTAAARLGEILREEEKQPLTPPLEGMAFVAAATAINHSCVPNCALNFHSGQRSARAAGGDGDGREGDACMRGDDWDGWSSVSLLALRDIQPETELTIAYVDANAPYRERTAALKAMHGFICRCDKCAIQAGFARASKQLAAAEAAAAELQTFRAAEAERKARAEAKASFVAPWLAPTPSDPPAAAPAPPAAPSQPSAAVEAVLEDLSQLGLRALEVGLFAEAEVVLRALLAASPPAASVGKASGKRRGLDRYGQRRGDALLRLGGALQRLHRFDEARAVWIHAAAELPGHELLRHEAELARAYYPCCDAKTAECGGPSAPKMALGGRKDTIYRLSQGREVWLSAAPLLPAADCARIVELCEAHAAISGGWSTKRHTTVPTTDMEVRAVDEVRRLFNAACEHTLFPFLERAYASAPGLRATAARLRVSDAFVVRYDAKAQRSLPTHQDDSHLSLTIALNGTSEYEGGGTSFEDLSAEGGGPVRPEIGHVVAFPGSLRHGGAPLKRGVRYIIAAFLWVSEEGGVNGGHAASENGGSGGSGGSGSGRLLGGRTCGGIVEGRRPRDGRPVSFVDDANAALRSLVQGAPCCRVARSHQGGDAGLAMYATRRIAAGETVLVERPFALTVAPAARQSTCAHCLADSREGGGRRGGAAGRASWPLSCGRCRSPHYCSKACMKAAAAHHGGAECDALKLLSPLMAEEGAIDPEDGETVTQAIRILALRAKRAKVDVGPAGLCGAEAYSAGSRGSRMVGVASTEVAAASLETISSLVLSAVPPAARVPSAELVDMLERHANNEFGVSRTGGEVVATASFVGFFHILNHSCCPNVVFDSAGRGPPLAGGEGGTPLFSLVALQDIEEGDELCHSYCDGGQDELLELYGFDCQCPRCEERRRRGGGSGGGDGPVERAWHEWQAAIACTSEACGAGDGVCVASAPDARLRCVHCAFEWPVVEPHARRVLASKVRTTSKPHV